MTLRILSCILSLSLLVVIFSCSNNSSEESPSDEPSITTVVPSGEEEQQVAKEITERVKKSVTQSLSTKDAIRDSIAIELSNKSPFLNLGCCKEMKQRNEECCCLAVLKRYKELVSKKDTKLGEYNMTDPILGGCRRVMPTAFQEVDHPPKANDEEGEYDDLF